MAQAIQAARSVTVRLGLTKGEWDALEHRFSATDCLEDVFEFQEDPNFKGEKNGDAEFIPLYAREGVYEVATRLGRDDLLGAEEYSWEITRAVMRDAVEGSTYAAAAASYAEHPQAATAALRVLRSAAVKVSRYLGEEVYAPTC